MGDAYHRARILLQVLLQPVDRFSVEVVGRLVEQQDVGVLQQQSAQRHASAFATRQCCHVLVFRRTAQRVHCAFQLVVDVPSVGCVELVLQLRLPVYQLVHLVGVLKHVGVGEALVHLVEFLQQVEHRLHALLHDFLDGFRRVEFRVLLQVSYAVSRGEYHFSLILLVDTRDNLQQRRLSGTVQTDDSDFRAVEERQVYVFEHLFLWRVDFAHSHH